MCPSGGGSVSMSQSRGGSLSNEFESKWRDSVLVSRHTVIMLPQIAIDGMWK